MKSIPATATCLCLLLASAACPAAPKETLWQKVLRISGVSTTPSLQKAQEDDLPEGGELWIIDLKTRRKRSVTKASGYRSPIFAPDSKSILALKSNTIWRVTLEGGTAQQLQNLPGLTKLIGFAPDDPDQLCLLFERDRNVSLRFLSLSTGQTTPVEYDSSSRDDMRLLSHLRGWTREYASGVRLYPSRQSKEGAAGRMEWDDILLKEGKGDPVNLTQANGTQCGHPSLSPKGDQVVFIQGGD